MNLLSTKCDSEGGIIYDQIKISSSHDRTHIFIIPCPKGG